MSTVGAGVRDEAWLRSLFVDHHPAVRADAMRRVPDVVDDVVSEVFTVAWRRRSEVPDPPLPWLYGAARHVVLHQRRAHSRQQRFLHRLRPSESGSDGGIDRVADRITAHEEVHRMLARLPLADAEVLMLWAWEQLDGAELAVALGCSPTAARVRLHRARRRARALLDLDEVADLLPVLDGSGRSTR